jgi:2-amino-4-hydroxy-6-hydroxymethyldihydropteridine diphosphokinase
MSHAAYIGFGSNMGDREGMFAKVLDALAHLPKTSVKKVSLLYETEPVGLVDGGFRFLNAVVGIQTDLEPGRLMSDMRNIELQLGKSPFHRSDMSRVLDLDLLLYGTEQFDNGDVQVPHPRMHLRAFVLVPLVEIAPRALHPIFHCEVEKLLQSLPAEEREQVRPWRPQSDRGA